MKMTRDICKQNRWWMTDVNKFQVEVRHRELAQVNLVFNHEFL